MVDDFPIDDFSQSIADRLLEQCPELQELCQFVFEGDACGYLLVEVPAPAGTSVSHGLTVSTAGSQISVEFDHYRDCFFGKGSIDDAFGIDFALYFVSQLLAEKIAVISWWAGSELRGSSTIENGKPARDSRLFKPFDRVRIRSWRGHLNADYDA